MFKYRHNACELHSVYCFRYICDKDYNIVDKQLFFDNPELIIDKILPSEMDVDNDTTEVRSIYIQCMDGVWNFLH